jgi:hypothetical protein
LKFNPSYKADSEKDAEMIAGEAKWCEKKWGSKWNASNALTGFVGQESIEEVNGFNLSDYENPACAVIQYTTP